MFNFLPTLVQMARDQAGGAGLWGKFLGEVEWGHSRQSQRGTVLHGVFYQYQVMSGRLSKLLQSSKYVHIIIPKCGFFIK